MVTADALEPGHGDRLVRDDQSAGGASPAAFQPGEDRFGHRSRGLAESDDPRPPDGAGQVVNAIGSVWAPSWRMVVELGPEVKAWGNYPGGQSGNPGSRFYDDRVGDWAAGRPYELVFLKSADDPDPRVVGRTVMRGER